MAKLYPHRQTVIIFVVCLISIAGAVYFTRGGARPVDMSVSGISSSTDTSSLQIDSSAFDDWKKIFSDDTKSISTTSSAKMLTGTDKFGRDFLTEYLNLQQSNLLDDQTAVDKTVSKLINSNVSATPAKVYTTKDLHTIEASDSATLRGFNTALAQVFETYKITKGESAIIREFTASSDPKALKQLDPIISTYGKMISQLLAMTTPRIMTAHEVKLLNGLSKMKTSAEDMRTMNTDAMKGMAGIGTHITGAKEIISAIKGISDILRPFEINLAIDQKIFNTLLR